jgi:large subunit ribosomal protein L3
MCKGLIGKKLGMAGQFASDGRHIPVTIIQVGPCVVTQIKTVGTDGYNALQLGFGDKKPSRITKPVQGHLKKSGGAFAFLREVEVDDPESYSIGQTISMDLFKIGEKVDVVGISKGRGFAGVIKRHGFSGGRMTHGGDCKRIPGSIGASAWPSKVARGKKMPGHYGVDRITTRNLEIVDIRPDDYLIMIKGAIPGAQSGLITIKKGVFAK